MIVEAEVERLLPLLVIGSRFDRALSDSARTSKIVEETTLPTKSLRDWTKGTSSRQDRTRFFAASARARMNESPEIERIANEFNRLRDADETESGSTAQLDAWLKILNARVGSDLLLVTGAPPCIRTKGFVQKIGDAPLDGPEIEAAVLPALTSHALQRYRETQIADSSYRVENLGRYRINLHRERGRAAAAIRALPQIVPSLSELNLQIGNANRGFLISSGKSRPVPHHPAPRTRTGSRCDSRAAANSSVAERTESSAVCRNSGASSARVGADRRPCRLWKIHDACGLD